MPECVATETPITSSMVRIFAKEKALQKARQEKPAGNAEQYPDERKS